MSDLERTQAALARTLRAYSATLTAYAELVGLDPEEDDELVYETIRTRLAELARRDEQLAAVRRFANSAALTAKALGRDDRAWLDVLILLDSGAS